MGYDLQFESDGAFVNDDKSWIRRREGLDDAMSITLSLAGFVLATHYPNGFIPSGIALGRVTATGLYVAYTDAATHGVGSDVFLGYLLSAIDMTSVPASNKAVGALFWRGTVKESRLPTGHGTTPAAKVDSGPTAAVALDGQYAQIRWE